MIARTTSFQARAVSWMKDKVLHPLASAVPWIAWVRLSASADNKRSPSSRDGQQLRKE